MKYYLNFLLDKIILGVFLLFFRSESKNDKQPFFILSSGRSGTTLLRKEFLVHSNAGIPPESYDFIPSSMKIFVLNCYKPWNTKVDLIINNFIELELQKQWRLNIEVLKTDLIQLQTKSFKAIINEFYSAFCELHYSGFSKWGDKTPYLALRINWIRALYPKAKYIHLMRSPEEVISSRMLYLGETFEQAMNRYKWYFKES